MECSLRHGDGMASADRFLDNYRATFGDAEAELDWTVYHVQPRQGFSDHHSLYLASDHNMGLIIEPNKRCDRAGKDAATVAVRPLHFDPNRHGNLTKTRLGCTRMSGSSIFRIALDIVKQMGNDCIEMVSSIQKYWKDAVYLCLGIVGTTQFEVTIYIYM